MSTPLETSKDFLALFLAKVSVNKKELSLSHLEKWLNLYHPEEISFERRLDGTIDLSKELEWFQKYFYIEAVKDTIHLYFTQEERTLLNLQYDLESNQKTKMLCRDYLSDTLRGDMSKYPFLFARENPNQTYTLLKQKGIFSLYQQL